VDDDPYLPARRRPDGKSSSGLRPLPALDRKLCALFIASRMALLSPLPPWADAAILTTPWEFAYAPLSAPAAGALSSPRSQLQPNTVSYFLVEASLEPGSELPEPLADGAIFAEDRASGARVRVHVHSCGSLRQRATELGLDPYLVLRDGRAGSDDVQRAVAPARHCQIRLGTTA
jgi:hypothetical protein